jgi:hypothetical protein
MALVGVTYHLLKDTVFLTLNTTNVWGWVVLCSEACPVHCRHQKHSTPRRNTHTQSCQPEMYPDFANVP